MRRNGGGRQSRQSVAYLRYAESSRGHSKAAGECRVLVARRIIRSEDTQKKLTSVFFSQQDWTDLLSEGGPVALPREMMFDNYFVMF